MEQNENTGDILIYQSENGLTRIDVRLEQETVWLTQQQMAELFQTSRTNVVEHIQHIYEEEELSPEATCRNFRHVQKEGSRMVAREMPFYNLDMIISLIRRSGHSKPKSRLKIFHNLLICISNRMMCLIQDNC